MPYLTNVSMECVQTKGKGDNYESAPQPAPVDGIEVFTGENPDSN